jgi:hypothetical protein
MAVLVPCLVALRSEFNDLFPGRDKTSDGWIGDPAHQASVSDHNPDERGLVHAIDVDAGLDPDFDMQTVVDHLVARCRTNAEKRLTYIIFGRRIWSASKSWIGRDYSGSNPHTQHAHFSASDSPSREQSVASWRLEEVPVALTEADVRRIWRTDGIIAAPANAATAGTNPEWAAASFLTDAAQLARANNALLLRIAAQLGGDLVDEQAIVAGVLAGLTPANAGAIPEDTARRVVEILTAKLAGLAS